MYYIHEQTSESRDESVSINRKDSVCHSRLQASSDLLEVVNFTVWLHTPEGCSLGEMRSYDSLLNMKAYCSANGVLWKRWRVVGLLVRWSKSSCLQLSLRPFKVQLFLQDTSSSKV